MRFVARKDIKNLNESILPFAFSAGYEAWLQDNGDSEYMLAWDENAAMPLKRYAVKGFNLLQPLYPPVALTGERLNPEEEKKFLNTLVNEVAAKKIAIRIIHANSFMVFNSYPDKAQHCPFGTYVVNLTKSEEELFAAVHSKHRNVIRNAEKQGIEIKWDHDQVDTFYSIYKQTMERSHMYCEPLQYFKRYEKDLKDMLLCGVAYFNNIPQCALFMPFTEYGTYYLYGASGEKIEVTGAMNYLHWQAMLKMKKAGVKRYDFAGARLSDVTGTKLEGIQNFKKRFGGELKEGFLWKIDVDGAKCKLFDGLLKLKGALKGNKPYMDIIDEENAKAVKS
jgi:hypothetical protein